MTDDSGLEKLYAWLMAGNIGLRADGSVWQYKQYRAGSVESLRTLIRPVRIDTLGTTGYRSVSVSVLGERVVCTAHRLIWRASHGPIPSGFVINHKNGKKGDNHLANLEAVSRSENTEHAYATGLIKGGDDQQSRRILACLQVAGKPLTVAEISESTGVEKSTIRIYLMRFGRRGLVMKSPPVAPRFEFKKAA